MSVGRILQGHVHRLGARAHTLNFNVYTGGVVLLLDSDEPRIIVGATSLGGDGFWYHTSLGGKCDQEGNLYCEICDTWGHR